MPLADDVSLDKIARNTEGYSGADIENLCREAGMEAIRDKMTELSTIEYRYFEKAMEKIKSTLTSNMIERYEQMAREITESRNIQEAKADFYK
jgi:transitional endoplasmic reticulum ATPase